MNLQSLAHQHFDLDLPCTEDRLKSAFRAAAKRLHTDTGGDKDAFIVMKDAYDRLCAAPEILATGHDDKKDRTTAGDLLTNLGLGLGALVNGRDCPTCSRKGYTTIHKTVDEKCKMCQGHGDIFLCRACAGTGQFTNPVGRKVSCRRCDAKGFWPAPKIKGREFMSATWIMPRRAPGAQGCLDCHATGVTQRKIQIFTHHTCGECNGTGEIKIYNPVIMKGGLSQKQRKRAG